MPAPSSVRLLIGNSGRFIGSIVGKPIPRSLVTMSRSPRSERNTARARKPTRVMNISRHSRAKTSLRSLHQLGIGRGVDLVQANGAVVEPVDPTLQEAVGLALDAAPL